MKLNTLLASILLSTFAVSAFAQTNTPRIDQRQENQQQRIDNGVKSGALTAKETNNLDKREAKLEADKQAAKADGKVTPKERRKLKREENRDSKAIYKKKHNARTAKPE
ncbi:MAG: hypothetical protein ACXWJK_02100 [Burkholderiaceae bacterium]